uniref:Uncharacterized protein n=1 Tax=Davidia involucrata TaxID=16924 RepID=A0A5B7CC03_DAVIN
MVAREVWTMLFVIFGMYWMILWSVKDFLMSWKAACPSKRVRQAWWSALLCVMWCIWWEHNMRTFEEVDTPIHRLKKKILDIFHIWIIGKYPISLSSLVNFLGEMNCIDGS